MLEGIAAVAVVFLLFVVLVQSAVVLLAHQAAEAIVVAEVRRVALGAPFDSKALLQRLSTGVPGGAPGAVSLRVDGGVVRAEADLELVPPGPVFSPISITVDGEVPIVGAP